MLTTHAGEPAISGGVMRPIKTEHSLAVRKFDVKQWVRDVQLFDQFDAVDSAAPFPLIDSGNTSFGRTQLTGPKLTP